MYSGGHATGSKGGKCQKIRRGRLIADGVFYSESFVKLAASAENMGNVISFLIAERQFWKHGKLWVRHVQTRSVATNKPISAKHNLNPAGAELSLCILNSPGWVFPHTAAKNWVWWEKLFSTTIVWNKIDRLVN